MPCSDIPSHDGQGPPHRAFLGAFFSQPDSLFLKGYVSAARLVSDENTVVMTASDMMSLASDG